MKSKTLIYTEHLVNPKKRNSIQVRCGDLVMGGGAPVLVQSMVNTNTKDIDATVEQVLELANAGCELVRITTPTVKDSEMLGLIVQKLKEQGCHIPLSADIHFQPKAAFEALKWVDKVRINPGNFVDTGILQMKEISDEEFAAGEQKVREVFGTFVREAKRLGRIVRIGVNHGSLSGRMMYRYGDTAEGMVESALEYLRVCEAEDFHNIVFSLKASNPKVMVQSNRLMVARLIADGHRAYPFHLGVTEAGDGEDGRIKSAAGIGTLLLDGIGDTIRVSLTEHPVEEIPVAKELLKTCNHFTVPSDLSSDLTPELPSYMYLRRQSATLELNGHKLGSGETVRTGLILNGHPAPILLDRPCEFSDESLKALSLTNYLQNQNIVDSVEVYLESPEDLQKMLSLSIKNEDPIIWSYRGNKNYLGVYRALVGFLQHHNLDHPVLLHGDYQNQNSRRLELSAQLSALLLDGIGDAVRLHATDANHSSALHFIFDLLQANGLRKTKAEYVSCPSCGRTLFDLEKVLALVRSRTSHLKEVTIAVMGCIVNGPGEMADADFGYVGGAPGKVSLYEAKTLIRKNVPEDDALDELVELIKKRGKWVDP